jgi:hypothetical protein
MSCVLVLLMAIDVVVVLDLSSRDASTPPFISRGEVTRKVTKSVTT